MSMLSEWQRAEALEYGLEPGEILDFCPRCTRLSAVGRITQQKDGVQKESYCCRKCGFHFTKEFMTR